VLNTEGIPHQLTTHLDVSLPCCPLSGFPATNLFFVFQKNKKQKTDGRIVTIHLKAPVELTLVYTV
jgi:hypothetical protein